VRACCVRVCGVLSSLPFELFFSCLSLGLPSPGPHPNQTYFSWLAAPPSSAMKGGPSGPSRSNRDQEIRILTTERTADGTYRHQVFFPVEEDARRRSQTRQEFKWINDADLDPSLEQQAANGRMRCDMELAKLRAAELQVESDGDDDWSDGWGAGGNEEGSHAGSGGFSSEAEGGEEEGEEEGVEEGEEGEGEEQDDRSAGAGTQRSAKRLRGEELWGPAEECPDLPKGWVGQVSVGGRKRYSSPYGGRFFSLKKAQEYLTDCPGQPHKTLTTRPVFPQVRPLPHAALLPGARTGRATGMGSQPAWPQPRGALPLRLAAVHLALPSLKARAPHPTHSLLIPASAPPRSQLDRLIELFHPPLPSRGFALTRLLLACPRSWTNSSSSSACPSTLTPSEAPGDSCPVHPYVPAPPSCLAPPLLPFTPPSSALARLPLRRVQDGHGLVRSCRVRRV
jgi:hypothetical protein